MIDPFRRTATWVIGAILSGVVGAYAASAGVATTGAPAPGVLRAETPIATALAILVGLAAMAGIGAVVGRLTNTAVGLFVVGCGLFVLARRMGSAEALVFSGGSLWVTAMETFLWGIALLGVVMLVFKVSGPLKDIEPDENNERPHLFFSRAAMMCAAAGVLVPVLVWVLAQTPMKGQVLAATIIASMVAGLAGRLFSPHVQPVLLFISPCVFGAVGHAVGAIMLPEPAAAALVSGSITPLSLPMPPDYAAGALLGVAMGLGWAKSFLHHEETPANAVTTG